MLSSIMYGILISWFEDVQGSLGTRSAALCILDRSCTRFVCFALRTGRLHKRLGSSGVQVVQGHQQRQQKHRPKKVADLSTWVPWSCRQQSFERLIDIPSSSGRLDALACSRDQGAPTIARVTRAQASAKALLQCSGSDAAEAVFLWSIERRDQSMLLRAGSSAWGFLGVSAHRRHQELFASSSHPYSDTPTTDEWMDLVYVVDPSIFVVHRFGSFGM